MQTTENTSLEQPAPNGMTVACERCRRPLPHGAIYCPACGKKQNAEAWYYKPLWIILLTVFILGPFSLPLVWRSPYMDKPAKWILSALILAYGLAVVWSLYWITMAMWASIESLNEANELMM